MNITKTHAANGGRDSAPPAGADPTAFACSASRSFNWGGVATRRSSDHIGIGGIAFALAA